MLKFAQFSLVAAIVWSCQPQKKDEQWLQAEQIHHRAYQLADSLQRALTALSQQRDVPSDSIYVLMRAIDEWKKNQVEVEGHHDDHDHHHNHSHNHSSEQANLTPKQMLELQLEMKDQVEQLVMRMNNL